MAQRVPIRGEAGTGYVLEDGYDLPPLMLTQDEIEAAVLGAQWVAGRADPVLARAAEDLIAKIAALSRRGCGPMCWSRRRAPRRMERRARRARHGEDPRPHPCGRKIVLDYRDEQGRASRRTVWPVAIGYLQTARVLAAWCELRGDFRSFRADRVAGAQFPEERYPERPVVLRAKWWRALEQRRRQRT